MKSLFLLLAVCQLAVAVNIVLVVIDGSNSCLQQQEQERAVQSLRNSTRDIISKIGNIPQCGVGTWHQLIGINMSMSITDNQCPTGWMEVNAEGVRACGRRASNGASCHSISFNNNNQIQYTRVCGRAIGYQFGSTDAFSQRPPDVTLDQDYVDGLSITYGFPRQHIWTFAAGLIDGLIGPSAFNCPCSGNPGDPPPTYLGNNWYCESGNPNNMGGLYSSDPLWDGENCEGTCCSNSKSPPWFSVELPAPTNDYIEARICGSEAIANEDIYINTLEIYIQ